MKKIIAIAILLVTAVAISATAAYNAGRDHALMDSSIWVSQGQEDGVLNVWLELEEEVFLHKAEFWTEVRKSKW